MRRILTALMLLVLPFQANAIMINSSVGAYDVTTITGILNAPSISSQLTNQVWFNNETLAGEFAGLVQDSLGLPNALGFTVGPLFVFEVPLISRAWFPLTSTVGIVSGGNPSTERTFAIAQQVPEPSTLALLSLGFLGIGAARKLKKH